MKYVRPYKIPVKITTSLAITTSYSKCTVLYSLSVTPPTHTHTHTSMSDGSPVLIIVSSMWPSRLLAPPVRAEGGLTDQ